ncbi:MAG: MBL fold metallo-hydrolase [Proteobacteria bacterium]|nr:MBL fold metallo-hydrolase [Pseudomonadota bacterium]
MIQVKELFDPKTFTLTYVVWDPETLDAVVIDPVLDYDPASSSTSRESFNSLKSFLETKPFKIHLILETHAHADHLSGSQILKQAFPKAKVAINDKICIVQTVFKDVFDLPSLATDGSQFDRLLKDGEIVQAGSLSFKVILTPGHTPACSSFLFEGAVFTGDALFMPDSGVGRCDFPKGDATTLFDSITQKLYTLPDDTRVFTGHDYQPNGRPVQFESTIGKEKAGNIHLNGKTTKAEFVKFRSERDKTLAAPKLLLPSVQFNIDAGHYPRPHANGRSYLSIPITEKA